MKQFEFCIKDHAEACMIKQREPDEFKIRGYELMVKEVKAVGTGGCVYLPRAWVGESVAVVRQGRAMDGRYCESFEIWSDDPLEKICDCESEYDALSRLDLLQQLEPEKGFSIQEMSVGLNRDDTK